MSGTELFPTLGMHCAEATCHQLDFLPFTCAACKEIFCLDHRTYKGHNCPKGDWKGATVTICPACTKAVRTDGGDEGAALKRHSADCNPSHSRRALKKAVCPVKGCSQKMTISNRVTCRDCFQDTCLRHRFVADHRCPVLEINKPSIEAKRSSKFFEALSKRSGDGCSESAKAASDRKQKNLPSVGANKAVEAF